jgi:hypothetical protein
MTVETVNTTKRRKRKVNAFCALEFCVSKKWNENDNESRIKIYHLRISVLSYIPFCHAHIDQHPQKNLL